MKIFVLFILNLIPLTCCLRDNWIWILFSLQNTSETAGKGSSIILQVLEHTALQFSWLDIRIWKLNYGARILLKCLLLNQIDFWLFDQILSSFIILIISQNCFNFAITVATATNEVIVVPGLWFLVFFLPNFPIFISFAAFS